MENRQPKDITCKKIAWKISDLSKLTVKGLYSDVFITDGCAWRVLIYPNVSYVYVDFLSSYVHVDFLSIYLCVADVESLPNGWSINANCSFIVANQIRSNDSVKRDGTNNFNRESNGWGYISFMPLKTFQDMTNGYILNDSCIIEVEISILETKQLIRKPESIIEVLTNPVEELIDFKGLGHVKKVYIPLLEEACFWHPSLIECQKKRTHDFNKWAFMALGRVLAFLKIKKVKDMMTNEEDYEKLKNLWDELKIFGFDLDWLEPQVKSALGMKNYTERAKKVKKLKNLVNDLEMEIEKLSEQLVAIKGNFEQARKDLTKAEESFEEKDVDPEQELGYEKPLPYSLQSFF